MKRFVIIGAGISGLSLAWFLKRRFGERIELKILEKSERAGGWVNTIHKDGFLFEQGPRSCRPKGAGIETLKLIEQLGLQNKVIVADPSAKYRYLWNDHKLRCLPSGIFSFLSSPLMSGVTCALFRDLMTKKSPLEDESIFQFFSRRFSPTIARRLIDPMTLGIYAGDITKLSLRSCFPLLYEWEQQQGSVVRGALKHRKKKSLSSSQFIQDLQKKSLFSFQSGMESLTYELAYRLYDHLYLETEVESLTFHPHEVEITLYGGNTLGADHVFSTIPSKALSPLFASKHQELSDLLGQIPSVSVVTVNLGYHHSVLKKKGFGYLVPTSENEEILGVVWDSSVFPQQNQIPEEVRLTVMIGGAQFPDFEKYSDQNFIEIAQRAVSRHLGIDCCPNAVAVKVAREAIPQYFVGHARRLERIEGILSRIFPRMTLSGNGFYGVSLNDCIAVSKRIEESILIS